MATQNENDNSVKFLFTEITNDITPKITSVDYLNHLKGGETYEKIIENHDNDINAHSTLISKIVNKNAQQDIEIAKKADSTSLASVATSGDYNSLINKPSLSPVATTGNYNDLSNKPSIPNAQVNSDWNAVNGVAKILNKPFIPTKTSDLTNDSGFVDAGSFNNNPHSLKAYLYEGGLLSDAQGLRDVKSYAHSYFDKTKFTVVGSPIITNDGIASNFKDSNHGSAAYVKTPCIYFGKSFTIELDFETGNTLDSTWRTLIGWYVGEDEQGPIWFDIMGTDSVYLTLFASDGTEILNGQFQTISPHTFASKTKYHLVFNYDRTTYCVRIYSCANGDLIFEKQIISNKTLENSVLSIGAHVYDSSVSDVFNGSIDLKSFSIISEGKTIFTGNKTRVDVIKQDYTINGSPTISADGIASGFGYANYLSKTLELTNSYNTLEIDLGEITSNAFTNYQWFFKATETSNSISKGFMIMITDTGKARWFAGSGASNYDIASGKVGNIVYSTGQKIKFKLVFTGTQYVLYSSVNGGNWQVDSSVDSTLKINFNTTIMLGTDGTANCLSGSYDVNGVKIIKDGEIVWQPCLKIPYIQSKTGSKIVDAAYRYRVTDMYEQYGYAPYYTLSDTDFTIPQGEIYGMIEPSNFDGNWVLCGETGIELSTATAHGDYSIDLSSIFPDDGCAYECILNSSFEQAEGDPDGSFSVRAFGDDNYNYVRIVYEKITQNRNRISYTGIIGTSRLLNIRISTDNDIASHSTNLLYYRRIGKNR